MSGGSGSACRRVRRRHGKRGFFFLSLPSRALNYKSGAVTGRARNKDETPLCFQPPSTTTYSSQLMPTGLLKKKKKMGSSWLAWTQCASCVCFCVWFFFFFFFFFFFEAALPTFASPVRRDSLPLSLSLSLVVYQLLKSSRKSSPLPPLFVFSPRPHTRSKEKEREKERKKELVKGREKPFKGFEEG